MKRIELSPNMRLAVSFVRQHWKFFLTVLVLGGLLLWVAAKYEKWFGNPPEPTYEGLKEPGRVLLTFGDEKELSRNVSWAGDAYLQDAYLELVDESQKDTLKLPATGEVVETRGGKMTYYCVKLRELAYHTTYFYRAVTGGHPTPWYSFTTQEQNRKSRAFLYIGDIQDSLNGETNHLLKDLLHRNPETEFLLFAGDLIERPVDNYWGELYHTLDSIGQSLPILNVPGNHDYLKGPIYQLDRRFNKVFSYFQDSQVGDSQVYTLTYDDMQFFCLDTTREFLFLPAQRSWLQQALMNSSAKWKIVVLHHPLYSAQGQNKNLVQRLAFNDLIQKYGVDLVLQGHQHAYVRTTAHDAQGKLTPPVYLISHLSSKSYVIQFDDLFQKFGSGSRYYQKITAHGDTLGVAVRDAETHALYDSLFITHTPQGHVLTDKGQFLKEKVDYYHPILKKKDQDFVERIQEYKKTHPQRF